jgi:glycosyltransferase involved in cell wall biosynthesis
MIKNFPDHVISVSEKIKKYYKKKYNKDITYIPNGVNIPKPVKLEKLKKYGLKKNNYILFLSRIVPEKGVEFLIKAFKQIKTDMKLVIAGDATHTEEYLRKVKNLAKDDKRIIFTGALYNREKAEAFSNAFLFVLPSTIEGMPIVLLEAMSFGIMPLASNIEENRDVVKKLGLTFRSKEVNDLKDKLSYLIKHPKLVKKRGKLCKEEVKAKYQWERIAKETMKVYENI